MLFSLLPSLHFLNRKICKKIAFRVQMRIIVPAVSSSPTVTPYLKSHEVPDTSIVYINNRHLLKVCYVQDFEPRQQKTINMSQHYRDCRF
jgi:hypothetical protein